MEEVYVSIHNSSVTRPACIFSLVEISVFPYQMTKEKYRLSWQDYTCRQLTTRGKYLLSPVLTQVNGKHLP